MSDKEKKVVVASDFGLLNEVMSAPTSKRSADKNSERGKIRTYLFSLLDEMVQTLSTPKPCTQIELTRIVKTLRAKAVKTVAGATSEPFIVPEDVELKPGEKWWLFPNTTDTSDRYREIRNNVTNLLKTRKDFKEQKKVFSAAAQKELNMIVYVGEMPKVVAAPLKK